MFKCLNFYNFMVHMYWKKKCFANMRHLGQHQNKWVGSGLGQKCWLQPCPWPPHPHVSPRLIAKNSFAVKDGEVNFILPLRGAEAPSRIFLQKSIHFASEKSIPGKFRLVTMCFILVAKILSRPVPWPKKSRPVPSRGISRDPETSRPVGHLCFV